MLRNFNNHESICELLDYSFKDKKLLERAFTRPSALIGSEQKSTAHNEALATLGDGALRLIIEDILLEFNSNFSKGKLSLTRDSLVNNKKQSEIAKKNGFGDFLVMSEAEEKSGGRKKEKILADCLEAVIGAVFFDSNRNYLVTKRVVIHLWSLRALYCEWLVNAFIEQNSDKVHYFLKCGADSNLKIHIPIKEGHGLDETFSIPMEEKKPSDKIPLIENSLLYRAVAAELVEIAKALLEHGADVNYKQLLQMTPLYTAAYKNNPTIVQLLCRYKPKLIGTLVDGYTALHVAAHYGHLEVIKLLLAQYIDAIDTVDMFGRTPLYIGVMGGHVSVISYFLECKADVNKTCIDRVNKRFETILHVAAEKNLVDVIKILRRYDVNLNLIDHKKQTALHRAIASKSYAAAKLLIEYGADIKLVDEQGKTPIDLAPAEIQKELLVSKEEKKSATTSPATSISQFGTFAASPASVAVDRESFDLPDAEWRCHIL